MRQLANAEKISSSELTVEPAKLALPKHSIGKHWCVVQATYRWKLQGTGKPVSARSTSSQANRGANITVIDNDGLKDILAFTISLVFEPKVAYGVT